MNVISKEEASRQEIAWWQIKNAAIWNREQAMIASGYTRKRLLAQADALFEVSKRMRVERVV